MAPAPAVTLTRVVQFTATHHLALPGGSDAENAARFGHTAKPHSHAYLCAVTVRGTLDESKGMIVDLALLDRVLKEEIVDRFDGADINRDPAFAGRLPTGEMLSVDIWRRVEPRLAGACTLDVVRVQENPLLYAEYRGR